MRLTRTGRNPLTQAVFAQVDSAGVRAPVFDNIVFVDAIYPVAITVIKSKSTAQVKIIPGEN